MWTIVRLENLIKGIIESVKNYQSKKVRNVNLIEVRIKMNNNSCELWGFATEYGCGPSLGYEPIIDDNILNDCTSHCYETLE